jgi:hypothetical protein
MFENELPVIMNELTSPCPKTVMVGAITILVENYVYLYIKKIKNVPG